MSKEIEIVRTLQVENKTIHVHIHLTEEEVRRLLLPLVTDAFASQLRLFTTQPYVFPSNTTVDHRRAK